MQFAEYLLLFFLIFVMPPLSIGIIRKTKARLQNRIGAPILQPFYDLSKLFGKGETVSETTSWIFRSTPAITLSGLILIAVLCPWFIGKPIFPIADLFLLIYLFALVRLFTVLGALDAGSVFSGFGASREVTLAVLVEPAIALSLASLGSIAHSSDLNQIFSTGSAQEINEPIVWVLAGLCLFVASLVELSRMPVDDPTTHLELTMVHEAMNLENSGKNLFLTEFGYALKLVILLGLSSGCILRAFPFYLLSDLPFQIAYSFAGLFFSLIVLALLESLLVKLRWSKLPEFIAYALALSMLCAIATVGVM